MTQDIFKIYLDRLRLVPQQEIQGSVNPDFLEVADGRLFFRELIEIKGSAYLADDHLILHLDVTTSYISFCKICNEEIATPFLLEGLYITEDFEKGALKEYDFRTPLRDAILLEIPLYTECQGSCPQRASLKEYFKQSV
ncbi:MAG: hypothetical protein JSR76_03980 [Verrucomicrobia bacterium]|nr:hypothetical protein [Verrucomicrobiota bacterium]